MFGNGRAPLARGILFGFTLSGPRNLLSGAP